MQDTYLLLCSAMALAAGPSFAHAQNAPAQPGPAQEAPAPAKPAGNAPKELVVTGQRADVTTAPDRLSFNVANDLQAQTGTLADALRAVPGVEVDLEGNVSLRGDPGVTILIDGRPSAMMSGEARANALLSMSAGQIERVEVITNPSAALSPEGSGGVINLVSKPAKKGTRSLTVRGNLGTEGRGSAGLSGALSRSALTMTGDLDYRRFRGESEITLERSRPDPGSGGFVTSRQDSTSTMTQSFRSGRFAIDYDLDKKNRLSTELNYGEGGAGMERSDDFVGPNAASSYMRESDSDLAFRNLGFRTSWRHTLGAGHELVADVELGRNHFGRVLEGVTTFDTPGTPQVFERNRNESDREDYGFKLDYKRPLSEGRSLNLGYEYDLSHIAFDFSGERGPSWNALVPVAGLTSMFEYDQGIHALYGTYQFELGKLEVQAGLRFEQVDTAIDPGNARVESGYFRAYPTLHLGYELSPKQKLRGSYSRRIQRPSPQDLNPHTFFFDDPLNLRRGNPGLRPQVTDSFELAWQLRAGGTFYSLTGYYRQSRDGVTDIVTDLGNGAFLTTRANLTAGRRAGIEAIANGKLSKTLSYNASGGFLWNEIDPRQAGVASRRSGTTGTARVSLTWQPTPKDYFQISGNYTGDQLLPQGYRESFGVLNLGYRRKINDRFSLSLTGQNLLDSIRMVNVIDTPTIRDRITQKGVGRIFTLGLNYRFGGESRKQEPAFEFDQGGGVPPQ